MNIIFVRYFHLSLYLLPGKFKDDADELIHRVSLMRLIDNG